MIGKLTGRFDGTTEGGQAIIEVGGVGYSVRIPAGALAELAGAPGAGITLFVHTAVREDAIDLYGFLSEEELSFFKQLMSVSGIGPKSALNILNTAEVAVLKRGIAGGNAASLTKVFGIGKKSAERIVVELRDKVVLEPASGTARGSHGDDAELVEALLALGYSAHESRQAIQSVPASLGSVNERLAAALKAL
ncbi:MAG: Holliday junction branch migration protein RuvA [Patescibacteria group bacterium]|nr:Holliday junction branch migration protein RuvA [Patescibacteria group bacterium]